MLMFCELKLYSGKGSNTSLEDARNILRDGLAALGRPHSDEILDDLFAPIGEEEALSKRHRLTCLVSWIPPLVRRRSKSNAPFGVLEQKSGHLATLAPLDRDLLDGVLPALEKAYGSKNVVSLPYVSVEVVR